MCLFALWEGWWKAGAAQVRPVHCEGALCVQGLLALGHPAAQPGDTQKVKCLPPKMRLCMSGL